MKKITGKMLLDAYYNGGVSEVRRVCEPYKMKEVYCEPCECMVPLWGKVCAACWSVIESEE